MRGESMLFAAFVARAALAGHGNVTFYRDVLPILQERCQSCHRAGEAAPMTLASYGDARPWAKAIREAVISRKMPPWFADPRYGKFANERRLSQSEIDTLVAWVDAGAVPGDPAEAPAPKVFPEGWSIGTPDVILEMPQPSEVPPSGVVDYQYIIYRSSKYAYSIQGAKTRT